MTLERCDGAAGPNLVLDGGRAPGETGGPGLPGYLPDQRCRAGRRPSSLIVATVVHPVVDVTCWLVAIAVAPEMGTPFLGGGPWTRDSVFLLVALAVQIAAGQTRVLKVDWPDFLGAERWTCAAVIAAAVTAHTLPLLPVNWSLLGAGSLLALLVRAAIAGGVLAIRQAVDAGVFLQSPARSPRITFALRPRRPRGAFAPAGLLLERGRATTEPIQRLFTVRD